MYSTIHYFQHIPVYISRAHLPSQIFLLSTHLLSSHITSPLKVGTPSGVVDGSSVRSSISILVSQRLLANGSGVGGIASAHVIWRSVGRESVRVSLCTSHAVLWVGTTVLALPEATTTRRARGVVVLGGRTKGLLLLVVLHEAESNGDGKEEEDAE